MATRSNIALLQNDNTCQMIYCHFDGYLDALGLTLIENYDTFDKVKKLINMGDASAIYPTIEQSKFYHRDYNDSFNDTKPQLFENIGHCWDKAKQEYFYLFREDTGKWYVACYYTKNDLEELEIVLRRDSYHDE